MFKMTLLIKQSPGFFWCSLQYRKYLVFQGAELFFCSKSSICHGLLVYVMFCETKTELQTTFMFQNLLTFSYCSE